MDNFFFYNVDILVKIMFLTFLYMTIVVGNVDTLVMKINAFPIILFLSITHYSLFPSSIDRFIALLTHDITVPLKLFSLRVAIPAAVVPFGLVTFSLNTSG